MIGALIVTFDPDIQVLRLNIVAISSQVDDLVIVDNGSKNVADVEALAINNINLIKLETNKGIAFALNRGMEYLESKGNLWALTLDQDSIVPGNLVKKLTQQREYYESDTGILSAKFVDKGQVNYIDKSTDTIIDPLAITSGSLTNISAWRHAGGFDEWLFIDTVDHDFNYRLLGLGYKVFKVNSVQFNHSLGEAVNRPFLKKILLLKKNSQASDHSAFRQYYIYRNGMVLVKRYAKNKPFKTLKLIATMRVLLLFKNPVSKLKAACHGLRDGFKYSEKKDVFFQGYRDKL